MKVWRKKNKEKIKEYKIYKYHNDIQYKLSEILRSRINGVIQGTKRAGSAVRDLGCSVVELIQYLENKFYNRHNTNEIMSWDNHSADGWHIDHIRPLISFDLTTRGQFLKACHYTNLQPLWAEENYAKGGKHLKKGNNK